MASYQESRNAHPPFPNSATPVKRENKFNIVTAVQPKESNSLPIYQDGTDFSYFSPIPFGTSKKVMYMLIDTGAASTWVMGSDCLSTPCASHNLFGQPDSTTLRKTNLSFQLTYGTGIVSGIIVNDTLSIGKSDIQLSFGLVSNASNEFSAYPMDGILGLARQAESNAKFPTVLELLQATKTLQANLIGINLQRNSDGSTDGELNLGSSDTTKYEGNLSYTTTTSDYTWWEIPVDDAVIAGNPCNLKGRTAIIDTGTSFVVLPPADAQQIHNQIPRSEQNGELFSLPCSSSTTVQLVFSGVKYDISPKDYVGNRLDGGNMCASNIIGKTTFGADKWLIGDVFMKNVYTVLDFSQNRIGELYRFSLAVIMLMRADLGFGIKDKGSSSPQLTSSNHSSSSTSATRITSTSAPSSSPSILLPESQASATSTNVVQSTTSSMNQQPSSSNSIMSKSTGVRCRLRSLTHLICYTFLLYTLQ